MTDDEVLAEFRAAEALLEGHFILSSGRHSPRYLQCARVLMTPARATRLANALAARIPDEVRARLDLVVSPAMGGVIIGHEMGRALGRDALFVERPGGTFELRRGFRSEDGFVASLGADWLTNWQAFTFAIGPRANFADARSMRSRFGVTVQDSINNPVFAPYAPGAGLYSAGAYGSLTWRYSKDWSFVAYGGWDRLTNGAANSSIVKATGGRNQFTAGVTASYTFQLER